jgi:hypothetical protein
MDASLLWIIVAMNALTTAEADDREHPVRRQRCAAAGAGRGTVASMRHRWLDRLRWVSAAMLAQPQGSRVRSGWIRALCDVAFVPAQRTSR